MAFSISSCRITFLFCQVSSSSVKKLSSIRYHIRGLILDSSPSVFSLFLMKPSGFIIFYSVWKAYAPFPRGLRISVPHFLSHVIQLPIRLSVLDWFLQLQFVVLSWVVLLASDYKIQSVILKLTGLSSRFSSLLFHGVPVVFFVYLFTTQCHLGILYCENCVGQ